MEIVKHGDYPKDNILKCPECHCEFRYFNNEAKYECSTPDEESMFGGFASYRTIKCPECNNKIIFDYQFTPITSWVDGMCIWFRRLSDKILNIFKKENKHGKIK